MNNQQQQQVQIKISDDTLKGVYANSMQISHTQEEFVIDYMNLYPPQGIVNSRVIVSPGHLKRMIAALEENLKKYEDQFGEIKVAQKPSGEQEIGFKAE